MDKVFDHVRSAQLLILDDLSTESATPWAREKLSQLLNHRYVARLATVITTADKIDRIDARLRSRMLDTTRCTFVSILAPAFRGNERREPAEPDVPDRPGRGKNPRLKHDQ